MSSSEDLASARSAASITEKVSEDAIRMVEELREENLLLRRKATDMYKELLESKTGLSEEMRRLVIEGHVLGQQIDKIKLAQTFDIEERSSRLLTLSERI